MGCRVFAPVTAAMSEANIKSPGLTGRADTCLAQGAIAGSSFIGDPIVRKMDHLCTTGDVPRGAVDEGQEVKSDHRREIMNPVGYADHETYLWQLDQEALDRTEFLVEPQAHHQHLDVGCGTGGFTCRALLPLNRPATRIVGADVSPSMLEYARRHNNQGSIAYELLDITSSPEVSAFVAKNGQFQRVYSFLCFHLVPDLTVAFQNISDLLTTDGECLVTACVTNPALDAWLDVHAMPEWKTWVADPRVVFPSSIYFNYGGTMAQIEEETRKCVVHAGLECIACEVIECTWLMRDVGHIFELYSDCFSVGADVPASDKDAVKAAYIKRLRPRVEETARGCEMRVRIYRVHATPHRQVTADH
ncbi:hypothetical protein HPB49_006231 [Dermacentor silvarum]|uniref:Uncharacterized protein n=1 Tax=Dermacentor silvarum TaxID=543639 RepID=A0ACB8CQA3_DERSI|nr:hypothetical protein HPB49_006231 [Dermacentor silvarum]